MNRTHAIVAVLALSAFKYALAENNEINYSIACSSQTYGNSTQVSSSAFASSSSFAWKHLKDPSSTPVPDTKSVSCGASSASIQTFVIRDQAAIDQGRRLMVTDFYLPFRNIQFTMISPVTVIAPDFNSGLILPKR